MVMWNPGFGDSSLALKKIKIIPVRPSVVENRAAKSRLVSWWPATSCSWLASQLRSSRFRHRHQRSPCSPCTPCHRSFNPTIAGQKFEIQQRLTPKVAPPAARRPFFHIASISSRGAIDSSPSDEKLCFRRAILTVAVCCYSSFLFLLVFVVC